MNALCAIEFDGIITVDQVEQAWNRLAEQVPIIGAHVDRTSARDARMVFGTPRGTLPVARYDDVESAWASESLATIDVETGPLVRCSLVEQDSGATVVITPHHSALDGRCMAELALLFARLLIDQTDVGDHPLAGPTLPLQDANGTQPAREPRLADMVATARLMRSEDGYVGAAGTVEWHDVLLDSPRDIGFTLFDLTEDETSGLISWARSQEATVHGVLSAAMLQAAASVSPGLARVGLSTTVDLRSRFDSPDRGCIGQAAGVISASYETADTSGAMARLISSDIRRRFDRGEAEVLFSLSGAGRFPVDHTTDRVIRGWIEQATPTLCIGNLGVVSGPAPPAVRRLTVGLAPTPNQVVFVSALTFRGRLNLAVGYDRNRLTTDPDRLVSAIHSQVLELARAGEQLVFSDD